MKTAMVALVLAASAVALSSCGGTPNPSSTPDPKQACLDANQGSSMINLAQDCSRFLS